MTSRGPDVIRHACQAKSPSNPTRSSNKKGSAGTTVLSLPPTLFRPLKLAAFVMQFSSFLLLYFSLDRWEQYHAGCGHCGLVTAFQREVVISRRRHHVLVASSCSPRHSTSHLSPFVPSPDLPAAQRWHRHFILTARMDGRNDDNGDAAQGGAMDEAFRQLDSLDASSLLGDADVDLSAPPPIKTNLKMGEERLSSVDPPSIESEAKVYQEYLQEVEGKSDADLYEDMLSDMGGSSSNPRSTKGATQPPSMSYGSSRSDSNQELWDKALEEAMQEVKLNNPSISDSVMDDAAFRKEIESIFDRGNEKLLESLEEIRKEQREWAKASADQSAQEAVDQLNADAIRLENAETNMRAMLDKVNKETSEVAKAVQELQKVQSELDNDFLYKLKSGGIVKQLSFVGFVLFSFRSIVDTVATLNSPGSDLTVALVQGGIALVCAVVFFLV